MDEWTKIVLAVDSPIRYRSLPQQMIWMRWNDLIQRRSPECCQCQVAAVIMKYCTYCSQCTRGFEDLTEQSLVSCVDGLAANRPAGSQSFVQSRGSCRALARWVEAWRQAITNRQPLKSWKLVLTRAPQETGSPCARFRT